MIYAFSPPGVAALAAVLEKDPLFAFDIDGTLAPIVEQRGEARIPDELQRCLQAVAKRMEVAIITGRAPKRETSGSVNRMDMPAMKIVVGRNARPISMAE